MYTIDRLLNTAFPFYGIGIWMWNIKKYFKFRKLYFAMVSELASHRDFTSSISPWFLDSRFIMFLKPRFHYDFAILRLVFSPLLGWYGYGKSHFAGSGFDRRRREPCQGGWGVIIAVATNMFWIPRLTQGEIPTSRLGLSWACERLEQFT